MELMALLTKVCSKCGRVLPLNMFYKNGGGSRRPDCKQCKQKAEAERRSKDGEAVRANRLKSDASIDELKKVLKYMEGQIGEH